MKEKTKIRIERIFDEKTGKTLQDVLNNALKIIAQSENGI